MSWTPGSAGGSAGAVVRWVVASALAGSAVWLAFVVTSRDDGADDPGDPDRCHPTEKDLREEVWSA